MIDKLFLLEYLDDLERKGYDTQVIFNFLKNTVDKRIDEEIKQKHFE